MSDVTVTVRGEHETRLPPERATVRVAVRAEGPDRATVMDTVARWTEPVRASIVERTDAGTILEWTSTRLTVRAERPWNTEGRRLAPVYYASIDLTATFSDAADLSLWVSEISAWDGTEVGSVDWHLTAETRVRVEREVAAHAVSVAVSRAEAYAAALGLTTVAPKEIADVGLLSAGQQSTDAPAFTSRGVAFAADAAPAMDYEPGDIVIGATVEARFTAS